MTHNHHYLATLRERGYRITPQREMIVNAVAHNPSHFTADEIYDDVHNQTQSMNKATVYRTLDMLVEEGLVTRSDFGQGVIIYAPENHGPHLHLVCRQCDRVIDADWSLAHPLQEQLREDYHFDLDLHHLAVFGLCARCQRERNGS